VTSLAMQDLRQNPSEAKWTNTFCWDSNPLVSVITLAILTILSSCGSKIDYEVRFVNTTSYNLDSLRVGVIDDTILTIGPHSRSGSFTVSRIDNFASYFSQPLLSLAVLAYSDSTSIYKNRMGGVFAFEALEEKKLNTIFVLLDTNSYVVLDTNKHYKGRKFWFSTKKDAE
jgi:hypothetical protein